MEVEGGIELIQFAAENDRCMEFCFMVLQVILKMNEIDLLNLCIPIFVYYTINCEIQWLQSPQTLLEKSYDEQWKLIKKVK